MVFLPFGKMHQRRPALALAVGKAAMVAMYFMHLKFETRTLGLIALTPLAIATLLVFVIMPDAFDVDHKTANVKPAAAGAGQALAPPARGPRRAVWPQTGCWGASSARSGGRSPSAVRAAAGPRSSAAGSP